MPLFVSPSEPKKLRDLLPPHKMSSHPERYGCDFTWPVSGEWWGVQRKEIRDFIASVQDGRLAKEVGQMKQVVMPTLILEGAVRYDHADELMLGRWVGKTVTRKQFNGLVFSLGRQGVTVLMARDHRGTADMIEMLMAWSAKDRHTSLTRRPGPDAKWGKATNREYQEHLLMGLPGVGPELAGRVVDKFGRVPWRWDCTVEELCEVEGIGKLKAKAMVEALG